MIWLMAIMKTGNMIRILIYVQHLIYFNPRHHGLSHLFFAHSLSQSTKPGLPYLAIVDNDVRAILYHPFQLVNKSGYGSRI